MELPLRAPKPAPDTELPLKDRKQMQRMPWAGALRPGWRDGLVEDSLAQVARPPLLLLGGLRQAPRFGSQEKQEQLPSSYRRLTTASRTAGCCSLHTRPFFPDTHVMPLGDMAVLLTYFSEPQ